jgi:hypothetical protein
MQNMMKGLVVAVAVLGACDRKGVADHLSARRPAAFDAWMPAGAVEAWQGGWTARLSLSLTASDAQPGDAIALDIHGATATASDAGRAHTLRFAVIAPCAVQFAQAIQVEGSINGGTAYHGAQFVMSGKTLRVGRGAAGYRNGTTAVVCSEGRNAGVHVLDANGVCTTWQDWFDRWESKPATCTWSRRDGHDVLTIGSGEWAPELIARGDVLESEQFTDYAADGYFRRR